MKFSYTYGLISVINHRLHLIKLSQYMHTFQTITQTKSNEATYPIMSKNVDFRSKIFSVVA